MKHIFLPIALLLTSVGSVGLSQEYVAATRAQPSGATIYAVTEVPSVTHVFERPCTQLEMTARIASADCGKLSLSEVAGVYFERTISDN
jgi:hypothetical protein